MHAFLFSKGSHLFSFTKIIEQKIPERYKYAFGYQVDFVINQLSNFLSAICYSSKI